MGIYLLFAVLLALMGFEFIRYKRDIKAAYERLGNDQVKSLNNSFGKINYLDEGTGETVLIAHGIFGG